MKAEIDRRFARRLAPLAGAILAPPILAFGETIAAGQANQGSAPRSTVVPSDQKQASQPVNQPVRQLNRLLGCTQQDRRYRELPRSGPRTPRRP